MTNSPQSQNFSKLNKTQERGNRMASIGVDISRHSGLLHAIEYYVEKYPEKKTYLYVPKFNPQSNAIVIQPDIYLIERLEAKIVLLLEGETLDEKTPDVVRKALERMKVSDNKISVLVEMARLREQMDIEHILKTRLLTTDDFTHLYQLDKELKKLEKQL